jgi:hypothetical protein
MLNDNERQCVWLPSNVCIGETRYKLHGSNDCQQNACSRDLDEADRVTTRKATLKRDGRDENCVQNFRRKPEKRLRGRSKR